MIDEDRIFLRYLDVLELYLISLRLKVEGVWFLSLLGSGLGLLWEAEVETGRSLRFGELYFFQKDCREIERVAWWVLLSRQL
jgi:hypothetical protein